MEHISKSAIEKYINCGESYRRRYIVKEKTFTSSNLVFGIVFHSVIEQYILQREAKRTTFDVLAHWSQTYKDSLTNFGTIMFDSSSPEEDEETGLRMFSCPDLYQMLDDYKPGRMTWTDEEGEQEGPAIEMKLEFTVPGVEVPFIGYIDMLCDDGIPLDFKTAGKKWSIDKAQKELQPAYYIPGLAQMGRPVPGNTFRHLVITKGKSPSVTMWETQRSQQEIDWALKLAAIAYQGIEKSVFVPNPLSWSCSPSYCEFYTTCMGGE